MQSPKTLEATPSSTTGETATEQPIYQMQDWLKGAGTAVFRSRAIEIAQPRIDAFADVTEDWQGIHVDPDTAKAGPFGTTIAHGFLGLSLLSPLAISALPGHPDDAIVVNRGFDKVRFVAPIPAGASIRAEFSLVEAEQKGTAVRLSHDVTVVIEESGKTALAARWLTMIQYGANE